MSEKIEKFLINPESEPYARGGNKEVFIHKSRPDVVIKKEPEWRVTRKEVRLRHFINNILNLITNGQIPKSKFSFSKPPLQGVERVDLGKEAEKIRRLHLKENPLSKLEKIEYSKAEEKIMHDPAVIDLMVRLKKISPNLDAQGKNFTVGSDRKATYIDDVFFGYDKSWLSLFLELIPDEIENINDERKKKRALLYLERVKKILDEPDKKEPKG